jgi:hypothetical protein
MSLNAINILKFLEKVDNRPIPLRVKLINNLPLTPEDLNVTGNLNLRYTPITSLPDNLKVGGSLDISYTNIKSLPNNLQVGGGRGLYLVNTPLSKLYTKEQIRQMVEDKGGFIKQRVHFEYIK